MDLSIYQIHMDKENFMYACIHSRRIQGLEFNISNINNKAMFYDINKI